jgi:hypothetical protein
VCWGPMGGAVGDAGEMLKLNPGAEPQYSLSRRKSQALISYDRGPPRAVSQRSFSLLSGRLISLDGSAICLLNKLLNFAPPATTCGPFFQPSSKHGEPRSSL